MKKRVLLTAVLLSLLFSSCSGKFDQGPKKEVSAYTSRSFDPEASKMLYIEGDYGNIELYCTNNEDIKYEANSIVRGTGQEEKLKSRLKDFIIKQTVSGDAAHINFNYAGALKNPVDTRIELRIYIPRKTKAVNIKLDTGRIKMQDDIRCDLTLELRYVNTEINRIKGRIIMNAEMGDIVIGSGQLSAGTDIATGMGNLRIHSEFLEGEHALKTGLGNIELDLPENTGVSIKTSGNVKQNEFENAEGPVIIKAQSEIGEIVVRKSKERL